MSFPHLGDYWIGFKVFGEMLGYDVIVPPMMTRRTLGLGARYSPDFVCVPFKYTLGCYIEALEAGADVLVQTGGG
jgi:predicted nucleotide-binding protein (sugar kinase/HSP70/actin superfamily)